MQKYVIEKSRLETRKIKGDTKMKQRENEDEATILNKKGGRIR